MPIWICEPGSRNKSDALAEKLRKQGRKTALVQEPARIDERKQKLKRLREHARDDIHELTGKLTAALHQKYPRVAVASAASAADAIEYITKISDGSDTVSCNNSGTVSRELKPGLTAHNFTVINSYLDEYDIQEKKILDYWDFDNLLENNLTGSFDVSIKMAGIGRPGTDIRRYLAVLGANAVSAEDGTIVFLQHFSNISKDLEQAEKVVIIIGMDKIVRSTEEAAFVTECMGVFGMESVLLGTRPKANGAPSMEQLSLPASDRDRKLHIIILDNGRTDLLSTQFRDLFLCIGCRACNRHCPIRNSFCDVDYMWSPKNYLNNFLAGKTDSIAACLHCEACRSDCPVDIDLPGLMWRANSDCISRHGQPYRQKILGNPERLARLGTFAAPLANRMMHSRVVRVLMEYMLGIDKRANLPGFSSRTFRKWFHKTCPKT